MYSKKSSKKNYRYSKRSSSRNICGKLRRLFRRLFASLICYCASPLWLAVINSASLAQSQTLVTQEMRYEMPAAGEVFLVWGINGWDLVPEEMRPAGTTVKKKVMHTPMAHDSEAFTVKLRVPPGATMDYGFLITKNRDGVSIKPVWEAENQRAFHLIVSSDGGVQKHVAQVALFDQPSGDDAGTFITQEIRYLMPEASEMLLVWGINGWGAVSPELRPPGTFVKKMVMHTPMQAHDDEFVTKLQVPADATIDCGFLVTGTRDGMPFKRQWIWDGNFHLKPAKDGVISMKSIPARLRDENLKNALHLGAYLAALLGAVFGLGFLLRLVPGVPLKLKKAFMILAVNFAAIVAFFFAGEVFLGTQALEAYVRTHPGQHDNAAKIAEYAQVDSTLGWVSNANFPEMNPQGFRDPKDFSKIGRPAEKKRVMILGDSFMWGAGVKMEHVVATLLQKRMGEQYEFYNLSVPGWGIDQMYLAYQRYRESIAPDIVILTFIDDDVYRALEAHRIWERLNKPSFTLASGELVRRVSASQSDLLLNKFMEKSIFFSLIMRQMYVMREAFPIVKHIFLNLARETQAQNEKFVIVRIPTQDHDNLLAKLNRSFANFAGALEPVGVPYLDPIDAFKQNPNWRADYYLSHGHLSKSGNQLLADYIVTLVFNGLAL